MTFLIAPEPMPEHGHPLIPRACKHACTRTLLHPRLNGNGSVHRNTHLRRKTCGQHRVPGTRKTGEDATPLITGRTSSPVHSHPNTRGAFNHNRSIPASDTCAPPRERLPLTMPCQTELPALLRLLSCDKSQKNQRLRPRISKPVPFAPKRYGHIAGSHLVLGVTVEIDADP